MKKIFLLLTIIFAQTQICLPISEDLSSQVIAENQYKVEKSKPEALKIIVIKKY